MRLIAKGASWGRISTCVCYNHGTSPSRLSGRSWFGGRRTAVSLTAFWSVGEQREIMPATCCSLEPVRSADDSCHRLVLLCLSILAAPAQPSRVRPGRKCTSCHHSSSGSRLPRTGRALRRGEFFTIRSCHSLVKALHSVRASDNARQEHNRGRPPDLYLARHTQQAVNPTA